LTDAAVPKKCPPPRGFPLRAEKKEKWIDRKS